MTVPRPSFRLDQKTSGTQPSDLKADWVLPSIKVQDKPTNFVGCFVGYP